MKVIHLPVVLPNWTRWYAFDSFGVLIAFERQPALSAKDGTWYAMGLRKDILQFDNQRFNGWKTSLRKLP